MKRRSDALSASVRQAYTVNEFCEAYRISRSTLYKMWREGIGPRQFMAGGKVLITIDAAREWVAAREKEMK